MLAQSSGIVNITFCYLLKAKSLFIDHSFECAYTLYNGGIQAKPECSIWAAIYTMVMVR